MHGQPSIDLWSVDIRRFAPFANTHSFLKQRVSEVLGLHYQMAWPNREFETGRGLRLSPLHDRLAAKGACFGQKNGWERPNWFAASDPSGSLAASPVVEYSFEKQNWFNNHAAEHRAAREGCAIFDQSGFSKYCVQGHDALAAMQFMCAGNVDKDVGSIVYTAMLNERGGFEADVTVVRVAADEFYVVSGTATTVRDMDWMRRQCAAFPRVHVHNVTCQYGVMGVMGPNARVLMQRITSADMSNEGFAFGTSRIIEIGHVCVRAMRVTYVGELGWELHVAVEQTCAVYDSLHAAASSSGTTLRDAGHYAINSLRLEKACANPLHPLA
jgi:glycine cleavage system aminomethyltransferase T